VPVDGLGDVGRLMAHGVTPLLLMINTAV
jgi:hypothetical protein